MIISYKLKRNIQEKNITVHKLSEEVGIHHSVIYKILNGKNKNPRVETLKKLADYFEITIDELIN